MIQTIFNFLFRKNRTKTPIATATIIPRADHTISRKHVSSSALRVLYGLHDAGFSAYLVGGCVRDLLLNRSPKDFDIATNAKPEQIKKLFRNCLLIGKRFRIAHVRFGQHIIEVTTFRALNAKNAEHRTHSHLGMLLRDNVYGTIDEDAFRRDFTINALYYNIADFSIMDFTEGLTDLHNQTLRLIGEPAIRYQEDPVRLLRAVRFAAKLNFHLHPQTELPIKKSADLLKHVAPARLFDEFTKLFFHGHAKNTYLLLEKYGLIPYLLPLDTDHLSDFTRQFILQGLAKTDERVAGDQSVNPAFLLAVFLWHEFEEKVQELKQARIPAHLASQRALSHILNGNHLPMAIPRRLTDIIRDIWILQWRLISLTRQNAVYATLHNRFRAAYDFLALRAALNPEFSEAAAWWTHYQSVDTEAQQLLLEQLPLAKKRSHHRKNRNSNHAKKKSIHRPGE